ncbi:ABC transporter substrate-binding protein [Leekyejoonella antrihumi]|uniref:ABC transporter substrate-binding protein n=1 Tax=Leekyejoonella antrihumi TaxID=1660198 RepID=A0A563DY30_9MICO|nr:ABC transporter substrate-binding protein [Leekyejoonella antrihumi]TWP34872.1 ABC transporter substrate-binding protein [Leekyejoonella antrihumi]
MTKKTKSISVIAAVVAATTLAACGGSSSGGSTGSSGSASGGSANNASASKGGTLYYTSNKPRQTWDPQRTYTGEGISLEGRLFSRSLVQFPVTSDLKASSTPIPDLATNTGTKSNGAKTWSFTLKDGVKWQDGSPITCADVKYGTSRTFATDVITGGPNYILSYLNIPTDKKTGLPVYNGPYKKAGQSYFDKAVTCSGKTITYHFNKAWPDFNLYLAALRAGDPYKQSQDKGNNSNYTVFSDGPYKLQGTWTKGQGGTFVRNPEWSSKTDNIRKALPDKIVFQEGVTPEIGVQQMISDSGTAANTVTTNAIPPASFSQITGAVAKRTINPQSPFTEYLVPNMLRLKNPKVREALAIALDKNAYIQAGGGSKMYAPAYTVTAPGILGFKKNATFSGLPDSGDPAKAKALLKSAGVKMPYPINLTYPGGTPTSDKQFGAIAAAWGQAGFKVTLNGLTDTYYNVVQKAGSTWDVCWGSWGADWPAMSTVIPPLFDSRPNLTPTTTGQDYGSYKSAAVNKLIDKAAAQTDVNAAAKIYDQIDAILGQDYAYIPLAIDKFYRINGSNITGYVNNPAEAMYPDLGGIGVKH